MTVTHQNDNANAPADGDDDTAGKPSRFAWFNEIFVLKTIFRLLVGA